MFRKYLLFVLVAALTGVLSACRQESSEIRPPEIVYGQDMCDVCGMLISEPQFAAALILEDGTPVRFDDLGELFHYEREHPGAEVKAWFVHDYNTEAWVNAEEAYFVMVEGFGTPMGFGIAAFEVESDAAAFAGEQGGVQITFAELKANPPSGRGMGMQ
jgi:copper chaperone NosL